MSQVENAFAWRGATGEREACWRKRGVSLVSGMIWRYRVIGLLLVCGQTVWRITSVMSRRHADLRGLGGSAFAWRLATGERETRWCKRGVSLVRFMSV